MGLFSSMFKSNEVENEKPNINWVALNEMSQLDEIISLSSSKAVLIFKHSTRCGISSMVLKNFENEYNLPDSEIELYFLDLLSYREISNEITLRFNVLHQSPQVLVIYKEQVIYHDSHNQISVEAIKKALNF